MLSQVAFTLLSSFHLHCTVQSEGPRIFGVSSAPHQAFIAQDFGASSCPHCACFGSHHTPSIFHFCPSICWAALPAKMTFAQAQLMNSIVPPHQLQTWKSPPTTSRLRYLIVSFCYSYSAHLETLFWILATLLYQEVFRTIVVFSRRDWSAFSILDSFWRALFSMITVNELCPSILWVADVNWICSLFLAHICLGTALHLLWTSRLWNSDHW